MQIGKDKVVSFHYDLSEEGGDAVGSSRQGDPVTYLHGHGNLVSGLEDALAGGAAGDRLEVVLPPEQAYGPRHDAAPQRYPIKRLLTRGKLRPGQVVTLQAEDGTRQVTVVKVGKFNVDVDTNHPLAGKTLRFALEVLEVREASAEELAHGHAHGPGGHHH
ncbi:MAG TPA: peptidylprolyl isomerase [Gammaproteobacteria bacterium]